jgi:hypothetical protein
LTDPNPAAREFILPPGERVAAFFTRALRSRNVKQKTLAKSPDIPFAQTESNAAAHWACATSSFGRMEMALTRRSLGLAALGGAMLPTASTLAKAPLDKAQAAGIYRMKVGTYELTIFNDGTGALPAQVFLWGSCRRSQTTGSRIYTWRVCPDELERVAYQHRRKAGFDRHRLRCTGFSPRAGHLPSGLAAAGVDPASIDRVVITHVHPDHANGLLTQADKKIAFPNATIHINADEYVWWMEGDVKVPDGKPFFKELFEGGRATFKPYVDDGKVQTFKDGAELSPGVTAVTAPGHTVGHTMLRIEPSGGGQLLI